MSVDKSFQARVKLFMFQLQRQSSMYYIYYLIYFIDNFIFLIVQFNLCTLKSSLVNIKFLLSLNLKDLALIFSKCYLVKLCHLIINLFDFETNYLVNHFSDIFRIMYVQNYYKISQKIV